jgi:aspartate/tyrosine/aromatic aminotransferase
MFSKLGLNIDEKIDLSGGTKGWNAKAKQKATELPNVINATVGTAKENNGDLLVLPTLVEECRRLTGGQMFSYADIKGLDDFVKIWNQDSLNSYPSHLVQETEDLSILPVTSIGLTGGLTLAGQTFFDANDPLLVPDVRWGNIDNVFIKNQRLKGINYNLIDKDGDLYLDELVSQIKNTEKKEKKMGIYLNFPNNPSGISPTYDQVKILQETISEISIPTIIIIDDAYEGYIYENNTVDHSLFPYFLGLNENVISVKADAVTKRYCAYGARVGTVTVGYGDEISDQEKSRMRELLAKIIRSTTSNSPRGIQEALVNILSDEVKRKQIYEEKKRAMDILENRYKLMKELTLEKDSDHLIAANYNSGFFGYFMLRNKQVAKDFGMKLLEKGLGTVPFESMSNGMNGIRVAFCSIKDDDIDRTLDILYSTK